MKQQNYKIELYIDNVFLLLELLEKIENFKNTFEDINIYSINTEKITYKEILYTIIFCNYNTEINEKTIEDYFNITK